MKHLNVGIYSIKTFIQYLHLFVLMMNEIFNITSLLSLNKSNILNLNVRYLYINIINKVTLHIKILFLKFSHTHTKTVSKIFSMQFSIYKFTSKRK